MPYATQDDLIRAFGEEELISLTDRASPPLGAIDTAVLAQAQAESSGEIDGYLEGRYTVPLSPVPPIVVVIDKDITRYRLYTNVVPEQVQKRYDDWVKYLTLVGQGKILLDKDSPAVSGSVQFQSDGKTFGRSTFE